MSAPPAWTFRCRDRYFNSVHVDSIIAIRLAPLKPEANGGLLMGGAGLAYCAARCWCLTVQHHFMLGWCLHACMHPPSFFCSYSLLCIEPNSMERAICILKLLRTGAGHRCRRRRRPTDRREAQGPWLLVGNSHFATKGSQACQGLAAPRPAKPRIRNLAATEPQNRPRPAVIAFHSACLSAAADLPPWPPTSWRMF
jgi:hypothetical protein